MGNLQREMPWSTDTGDKSSDDVERALWAASIWAATSGSKIHTPGEMKMRSLIVAAKIPALLFVASERPYFENPPAHEPITNSYEIRTPFSLAGPESCDCLRNLGVRTLILTKGLRTGRGSYPRKEVILYCKEGSDFWVRKIH